MRAQPDLGGSTYSELVSLVRIVVLATLPTRHTQVLGKDCAFALLFLHMCIHIHIDTGMHIYMDDFVSDAGRETPIYIDAAIRSQENRVLTRHVIISDVSMAKHLSADHPNWSCFRLLYL